MLAAPLNAKIDLVKSKSEAVEFPTDESVPLQLNIFSKDSRHFDIVSEVSYKFESETPCSMCRLQEMCFAERRGLISPAQGQDLQSFCSSGMAPVKLSRHQSRHAHHQKGTLCESRIS